VAFVGIAYTHSARTHLHYLGRASDIRAVNHGIFGRRERLVLPKHKTAAVVHPCIAGDSGCVMICFCKAAVYHHKLAVGAYRRFSGICAHGHMAVDYMAMLAGDTKRVEYHVAHIFVVTQLVIIAFLFFPQFLVGEEVALECCHTRLVEQRRIGAAPQIPVEIDCIGTLFGRRVVVGRRAHHHFDFFEKVATLISTSHYFNVLECAVGIERYRRMEQQIGVIYAIHAPVREYTLHMLLQTTAYDKRMMQLAHKLALLASKRVGLARVYCRKTRVAHLVRPTLEHKGLFGKINMLEHFPLLHMPLWMLVNHRRLEFELYHTYSLVHLCQQTSSLVVVGHIVGVETRLKIAARVVAIHIHCKGGKRHKIYAIAFFKSGHIAIAQRQSQHIGYTAVVAGRGSHPQGVVIAPLDIEVAITAQYVHNQVSAGASVVDVSEHMKLVYAQALYHIAQSRYESIGLAGRNDSLYNAVEVFLLVIIRRRLVKKLLYDIGKLRRKRLANFGARILRRHCLTHFDKLIKSDTIEITQFALRCPDYLQLSLGIIYQRAQLAYLRFAKLRAERFRHLALDISRCIAEYVLKCLIFAMQISHKMLGALRKTHYSFQIHNFRAGRRYIGICLCQQFKKPAVTLYFICAYSVDHLFPFLLSLGSGYAKVVIINAILPSFPRYCFTMKFIFKITTLLTALCALCSCIEDGFTTSPSDQPVFSVDTLAFGDVFTGDITPTHRFVVHNPHSKSLSISNISMSGNNADFFHLNVDGISGKTFSNVEIRSNDSIFVFVEAQLPETEGLRTDFEADLNFSTNGRNGSVKITASGVNAIRLRGETIDRDTRLADDKPYIIYDSLVVAPEAVLTVAPGTKLCFHDKASLIVHGSLIAEATPQQQIILSGDRTGNVVGNISFDIMSRQWKGVVFTESSAGNRLSNTIVCNTSEGVVVYGDSLADYSQKPQLYMLNCRLRNSGANVLEAYHSAVTAYGCEFAEASQGLVYLHGGAHSLAQCSFSNIYLFTAVGGPAIRLAHLGPDPKTGLDDGSGLPYLSADFTNSIIYGLGTDLSHADLTDTSVTFRRCLFKSKGSDDEHFIECLWNEDPLFYTVRLDYYFDYRLQPGSPAIGTADPDRLPAECSVDGYGIERGPQPDLGAYVFTLPEE